MTVRIDNPPRNFMNDEVVGELDALTSELENDATIGAVVITGAGERLFATHYDIDELISSAESTPEMRRRLASGSLRAVAVASTIPGARAVLDHTRASGILKLQQINEVYLRMNRSDKVFVAAVNGMATGSGCELALACDIRIVADGDFVIGLPELTIGLIPGAGGSQRLTHAVGAAKAIELMLEARPLAPQEALDVGLVHRIVPPDKLLEEAQLTAERLARRSGITVGATKRAVYEGAALPLPAGLKVEQVGFMASASSKAAQRAMKRFGEQLDELDESVPSPWADAETMKGWSEGTLVDIT
jgi:enoyl-CoA hydratase/carnithine racemase